MSEDQARWISEPVTISFLLMLFQRGCVRDVNVEDSKCLIHRQPCSTYFGGNNFIVALDTSMASSHPCQQRVDFDCGDRDMSYWSSELFIWSPILSMVCRYARGSGCRQGVLWSRKPFWGWYQWTHLPSPVPWQQMPDLRVGGMFLEVHSPDTLANVDGCSIGSPPW